MTAAPEGKKTLSRRVFATVFIVAMAVIVVFTVAGAIFIQNTLADSTRANLEHEAQVIAAALNGEDDPAALLRRLGNKDNLRITLVEPDGSVAYDNEAAPALLPNHKDRPEVAEAMRNGTGEAERSSSTLDEVMLYRAVRLKNGQVIRLAQGQASVLTILLSLVGPFLAIAAVGAVVSFVAAKREARAIIEPLREVDLDHPRRSYEHAYAEMVPMLERIETQRKELKRQMAVLADNDRMRREFTANITHELKTPLTTISGYAELIANGMVEGEDDLREFGGRIYSEAGRLASLVNDILTLSNLDEAERSEDGAVPMGSLEPVELARTVRTVAQRLEPVAEEADVTVELDACPVMVEGVARLIDELVYNLANNAIRYNRPGGSVAISTGVDVAGHPFLKVADTGIGIAPEEQDKVFERFYRVDKSRSKARGGTGLGLAIVKHAAHYHHAQVDLESALGEGTVITVTFPHEQRPMLDGE